jgi:hypothetical protein
MKISAGYVPLLALMSVGETVAFVHSRTRAILGALLWLQKMAASDSTLDSDLFEEAAGSLTFSHHRVQPLTMLITFCFLPLGFPPCRVIQLVHSCRYPRHRFTQSSTLPPS